MRVLMFGWEFPPSVSGGLGIACLGITEALTDLGCEITFVLPRVRSQGGSSRITLLSAAEVYEAFPSVVYPSGGPRGGISPLLEIISVDSPLRPYHTESPYLSMLNEPASVFWPQRNDEGRGILATPGEYGPNLFAEVRRYAEAAGIIAGLRSFDVIHAHDWMTVLAAIRARTVSRRPFIFHVHSLERDRSGDNINQEVYNIERTGMEEADRIIAVSNYTKDNIIRHYGIPPDRISIVHNAVSHAECLPPRDTEKQDRKVVLFLGRITFQKGPDYFVESAVRVLEELPEVTFIMAGSGDMMMRMIARVAELGVGKNFHFTGFLERPDIERIFSLSDLYVMPSVSEPFGISPLEAVMYGVPVIISKQSGVAEILKHALAVDFWDVDELANKMISVLKHPALARELALNAREELKSIKWENAAQKMIDIYRHVLQ